MQDDGVIFWGEQTGENDGAESAVLRQGNACLVLKYLLI